MPIVRAVRGLRVKALLIAIPIIGFLLWMQNEQLPSLMPEFRPADSPSHAAKPVEDGRDDYRHQYISAAQALSPHTPSNQTPLPTQTYHSPQHEKSSIPTSAGEPAGQDPTTKPTGTTGAEIKASNDALSMPTPSLNSTRSDNSTKSSQNVSKANDPTFRKAQIEFWKSLESLLDSSKPDCPPPTRLGNAEAMHFNPSVTERPKKLDMPKEDVERMRKAHRKFVDGIQKDQPRMPFTPGTRGLVSTGGGKYLPVFVISLRMLRRTGTTLPVELFLADQDEYEENICTEVLPSLNATCVIMSDILKSVEHDVEITKYQFKVFAMIFSSFEEILFLDADSFPVHNPEELFASELFKSHGLISWPDFWASSISEYYYAISEQSIPSVGERASSETGELLISKKTHQKFLLLATYYNYYGPTHYYVLFSQGSSGEGDKDTFLPAAMFFNQTFYATSEPIRAIGHRKPDGSVAGSAMVQYDPIQDHNLTQQGLWRVKDPSVAEIPRPFFVHANFPKFNPATIFKPGGPAVDENGTHHKAWTMGEETMEKFGFDVEKDFWSEIKWVACELEDKFETWKGEKDICKITTMHWEVLYGGKS
jgi:alpha 1,2-mannosyltransferase